MNAVLRYLWFALIVRPVVFFVVGVNVRNRERLVSCQPAIVVANHNSHLDTLVLMTLFPFGLLGKVRPAAAMDYFLRNRLLSWFALKIIGIVPIRRDVGENAGDPLAACSEVLAAGGVLILFPEGTRGEPEQITSFKTGIAHLAKRHPDVPIVPVFLLGLGKALPKGEIVLVPFFCDVVVGEHIFWGGSRTEFMDRIEKTMMELAATINRPSWE